MAQYDLLLTQNVHVSGIEFSEKYVNIAKAGLLSADTNGTPTVLAGGTNGYMLVRDDAETTGLKWVAISAGHTQNTDTGTTNDTFTIDADAATGKIELKVIAGASDYKLTLQNDQLTDNRIIEFPDASGTVALTSQLPSSPLTYSGVIDCSTNPNYPAATVGEVYIVSVAGKIGGASGPNVEVGDTLICHTTGSAGDHATVGANWNIVQKNIDGAVTTAETNVTDGELVVFDGITGKIIKGTGSVPGTMAYETATNYVAKSLFDANTVLYATTDDTPAALTVAEQTIVGRITSGAIDALTNDEVMGILWQTAPATKTSTGIVGQIARDDNFFYICTATNVWKRSPIATNW